MSSASPLPLSGLHAVVTGGSRGIGLAIAHALLPLGADLTLMARDVPSLDEACKLLRTRFPDARIETVSANAADAVAVTAAFASLHAPVDILVNNAGQAHSAPLARTGVELWQRMLDVNLTSAYLCIHAALPGMLERAKTSGYGRIINIASSAGQRGYAYVSAYCAAKHGMIGLTRSLALELATTGVTVNAVCPGYTETDLVGGAIANIVARTGKTEAQARAALVAGNPQQRMIQPFEVANAVAWLVSQEARSINGQDIAVSGGEVM